MSLLLAQAANIVVHVVQAQNYVAYSSFDNFSSCIIYLYLVKIIYM